MRRKTILNIIYLSFLISLIIPSPLAANQGYYFGEEAEFNPAIPSPESFLGYETGTHHTRYDQLVNYFKELEHVSENAELRVIGQTYQGRPLLVLVVSSVENLSRLEEIRTNHLKIADPNSGFDHHSLPVISLLGFGVHGNEASAAEAAILTAYYLLASLDNEVNNYLESGIFFIKPSRNPDGHDRFAQWINSNKSRNLATDPADLEHNEPWPGSRSNHYWFDLNRDWLPAIHVESRARLDFFHSWLPHLATCHHEMGTNSTFFFEPTKPVDKESPIVPRSHYELNHNFAEYFAEALDNLGTLYYTKERFDNFNPTFGSSYPDYNGSLAILFEQASSRGFLQERNGGIITFQSAIRNQLAVSIASIRASVELKSKLIENQKNFFKTAFEHGNSGTVKGYIFGDRDDVNRNLLFIELLQRHRIKVYVNEKIISAGNQTFYPGKSFIVPTAQAQNRMVELFFNKDLSVPDSVFYDGSSWTVVLAYGLNYSSLTSRQLPQNLQPFQKTDNSYTSLGKSGYAYIVRWNDYNSPAFLSSLLQKNITVHSSFRPFSSSINQEVKDFGYGTLVIPVNGQAYESDKLYAHLKEAGKDYSLEIYPVETGFNVRGVDLGSDNIRPLRKPEILILTGPGISSLEAGEAWFLIDNRLDASLTRADVNQLDRVNLERYNTIVLPGINNRFGGLQVDNIVISRLKEWIGRGGTLIVLNQASEWAIQKGLANEKLIPVARDSSRSVRFSYTDMAQTEGAKLVGGTILNAELDITHPLAFGFNSGNLPVLKNNTLAIEYSASPYNTVAAFSEAPLISGYINTDNLNRFSNTSALLVSPYQRGRVILFAFNPVHRASWHACARLFYNAIYFSHLVSAGHSR